MMQSENRISLKKVWSTLRRYRDELLGLCAMLAFVLCILACRPSWSPDSTQLVFPFYHRGTEKGGLALYDLPSGSVRHLGAFGSQWAIQTVWRENSREIIAIYPDGENTLAISSIDVKTGRNEIIQQITGLSDDDGVLNLYPPVLEKNRYLWFAAGSEPPVLKRLDLIRNRVDDVLEGAIPSQIGDRVYYIWPTKSEEKTGNEIGWFDSKTLNRNPIAFLKKEDYPYLRPVIGPDDGSQIIVPVDSDENKETNPDLPALVVLDGQGEFLKNVSLGNVATSLAFAVWGPEPNTVWVTGTKEATDEIPLRLIQVNLETEETFFIPFMSEGDEQDSSLTMQPSLSPDKRFLAFCIHCIYASGMGEGTRMTGDSELILLEIENKAVYRITPPPAFPDQLEIRKNSSRRLRERWR